MHERGRLQRLPSRFAGHPCGRQSAQIRIHRRQQLRGGLGVALLDGVQDDSDVAHAPGRSLKSCSAIFGFPELLRCNQDNAARCSVNGVPPSPLCGTLYPKAGDYLAGDSVRNADFSRQKNAAGLPAEAGVPGRLIASIRPKNRREALRETTALGVHPSGCALSPNTLKRGHRTRPALGGPMRENSSGNPAPPTLRWP